jgi:AcrR family transcriptional regulator
VPRRYQLKQRAESQDRTRQRIVDAAVALHTSIGPARTTVSAIAERAGVQRHTFYRHFPDDRSLWMACSGQFAETNPLPDPSAWERIDDPGARVRQGFGELYRYYERHADALAPIVRDAEVHAVTREVVGLRMAPAFEAMLDVLASGFTETGLTRRRVRAVLRTFLAFPTWRQLRAGVKSPAEAVDAAVRAVVAQASLRPPHDPR